MSNVEMVIKKDQIEKINENLLCIFFISPNGEKDTRSSVYDDPLVLRNSAIELAKRIKIATKIEGGRRRVALIPVKKFILDPC